MTEGTLGNIVLFGLNQRGERGEKILPEGVPTMGVNSIGWKAHSEAVKNNVDTLLIPDISPITVISGGTKDGSIGKAVADLYKKKFFIGGRNRQNLQEVSQGSNTHNTFVEGDIYEPGTPAYNFYINELPNRKLGGVFHMYAAVAMDKVPTAFINNEGNVERSEDPINPLTNMPWEANVMNEQKKEIRREMVDKELKFQELFYQKLLQRESREQIILIETNSIMSKMYEHSAIKGAEYGRLKQGRAQLISKYNVELQQKNVWIKNVILPPIDTAMVSDKGGLSGLQTEKVINEVGPYIPLNGKAIQFNDLINPEELAVFLKALGEADPSSTPSTLSILTKDDLDLNVHQKQYKTDTKKLMDIVLEWGGEDDVPFFKNTTNTQVHQIDSSNNGFKYDFIDVDPAVIKNINLTEEAKDFLLQLRQNTLNTYEKENSAQIIEEHNNRDTIDNSPFSITTNYIPQTKRVELEALITNSDVRVYSDEVEINEISKTFLLSHLYQYDFSFIQQQEVDAIAFNHGKKLLQENIKPELTKKHIQDFQTQNITIATKILDNLSGTISYEEFLNLCINFETNLPNYTINKYINTINGDKAGISKSLSQKKIHNALQRNLTSGQNIIDNLVKKYPEGIVSFDEFMEMCVKMQRNEP